MPRWILAFLLAISGMLITSVIFFSFVVYSQQQQIAQLNARLINQTKPPMIANGIDFQPDDNQLSARIDLLSTQLSSLSAQVNQPAKTNQKIAPAAKANEGVKEYSIYMGSGSTVSREWVDINSALVKVDTSKYSSIKEIRFETSLSILGGEVSVRLKNKTTGGVFYDSTMSHNTSTSTWKTSAPLSLPNGEFEYIVQLKSSSGELAKVDGSRIKIILN